MLVTVLLWVGERKRIIAGICSVTLASSNPLKPPLPVVVLDPLPQPPLLQHRVILLARPGRSEKIPRPFPLAAAVVMVRGFMARAMNE